MNRFARALLISSVLLSPLALAGCGNTSVGDFAIDPSEWLAGDFLGNKKKLPGDRKAVFPEGVPGVERGVPPELMKGRQASSGDLPNDAQALSEQRQTEAPPEPPKARPKAKPKPKVAVRPIEPEPESRPTSLTVRREAAPPQRQQQTASPQWPEPAATGTGTGSSGAGMGAPSSGVQWPDPPPMR